MTVFTIAYNEEMMLPYFVAHYREMFPGCRIVVYNNMSTDNTKNIALTLGCEVIDYDTDGKLSDSKYLEIKNNCWKNVDPDERGDRWVLIADVDEHCYIRQKDIDNTLGLVTIFNFRGWNMVALKDTLDINSITHGIRAPSYDKSYLFNATYIEEINYRPGCHKAEPEGTVLRLPKMLYNCAHYKYINIDYMISRHAHYASRLSDENLRRGWGGHYQYTPDQIREEFEEARKNANYILL